MNPEPHRIATVTAPWCQSADAHGVRRQAAGQVVRRVCAGLGDQRRCRNLLAHDRTRTTLASHRSAADAANVRALLIQHMTSSHEAPSRRSRP